MNGVLIIDKEKGKTSRDIVNEISKKFKTKKVGHTGTLDPIATGILIVCVGKATKLVDILTSDEKEYIAECTLGIETDTLDSEGEVLNKISSIKSKEEIVQVLNSFKGKYLQEVPKYSAIKINGKKLYEYARNKEDIVLPKREVEIKSIELLDYLGCKDNLTTFRFRCTVSKGTYIRSLIRDIAEKLNTVGIMTELRRVRVGNFSIANAKLVNEISDNDFIKITDVLKVKKIELTSDIEKKVLNGAVVDNIYNVDEVLFTKNLEEIALYKLKDNKLKPYIMFKGGIL